jgi:hypothetical protein
MGTQTLDVVRVGDPPDLPLQTADPAVLLWTEREDRILITRDKNTMPTHLRDHLQQGRHCPGIFMLRPGQGIHEVLEFLVLAAYLSQGEEWQDRIAYIP